MVVFPKVNKNRPLGGTRCKVRETPKKISPGNLSRPGIEHEPAARQGACYRLTQSGGLNDDYDDDNNNNINNNYGNYDINGRLHESSC